MKQARPSCNYIRLSMQAAPLETVWKLLFLLASGVYPSALVLVSGHMIDTGLGVLLRETAQGQMIKSVLFLCALMLAWHLLEALDKLIAVRYAAKLTERINLAAVEKRARVKYAYIEQEPVQKLFARISENPAEHVKEGADNLLSLGAFALEVAGILVVIAACSGWIALLYCACCVPLVLLSLKCGAYDYEIFEQTSDLERRRAYYEQILTARELTEERELFGYTPQINQKWDAVCAKIVRMTARINAKVSLRLTSAAMLMALLQVLVMLLLLFPLQVGTLSIGVYLTIVKQQNRLEQKIAWELMEKTETFENCRRYGKDYAEFLALEEDADALCSRTAWRFPMKEAAISGAEALRQEPQQSAVCPAVACAGDSVLPPLRFEQVTFCYEGREKSALTEVSFSLEPGKSYALVGENGAGKTTLVKLLLGMYDSYRGNIYIGDRELRSIETQEKKACLTVLFQDFFHYEISVRDYLNLGKEQPYVEARLYKALADVGLAEQVEALPDGLDTRLGKMQEGVDLSGGQWQKLAAARCMLDDAPLLILDEPTSAMDALSEKSFYQVLTEAAQGRTALFITHRLGLALYADEILVMEGGRLCERGTHEDLMALRGRYYQMYEAQRSWYQDEA